MSKRHAEKYLTDRNADEDEDEEVHGEGPFKQASAKEIAARPIRGLPGRKTAAARPPAPAPAPVDGFGSNAAPKPAFSGFAFGGSTAGASTPLAPTTPFKSNTNGSSGAPASPFNFTPTGSTSSSSKDQDKDLTYYKSLRGLNISALSPIQKLLDKEPFTDLTGPLTKILENYKKERQSIETARGKKAGAIEPENQSSAPSATKAPSFGFGTTPSASGVDSSKSSTTTASAAPKPFAGFSFNPVPAPSTPSATSSSPSTPAAAPPKPFAGFSFTAPSPVTTPVSTDAPTKDAPQPKNDDGPKPPAPPASFTFAGSSFKPDASKDLSTGSGASSPAGGFVFNPSKVDKSEEKSAFSFPPAAASTSKPAEPEKSASPPAASSGLNKAASPFLPAGNSRARQPSPLRQVETVSETPATEKKEETVAPPKPFASFSFNPPASSSPAPSTTNPPTPSKTIAFGSGTSPKASSTAFNFGSSSTAATTTSNSTPFNTGTGFSFGGTTSGSFAPPTFSFGSSSSTSAGTDAPKAAPAFGGFGSTGSSSFSFGGGGASSGTPAASTGGFSGFSFKPAASGNATPVGSTGSTPAPEGNTDSGEAADSEGQEKSDNALLQGGAGEENEETLFETRAKLWKHDEVEVKDAEGKPSKKKDFVEYGISIVKIKKDNDSGKVRLLGRSDANGKVQMNFTLFAKLDITLEKSFLTFLAFDGTDPKLFRLRLRNAEAAGKLKDAIEEQVKAL